MWSVQLCITRTAQEESPPGTRRCDWQEAATWADDYAPSQGCMHARIIRSSAH